VALALTFAAGFVDIVGYISAFKTFTAHMTGNTVHLAQGLAVQDYSQVTIVGGVLMAFVFGSLVGRIAIEVGARSRLRRIASVTLLLEFVLLLFAARLSVSNASEQAGIHGSAYWFLILLATAMGLQTATLTRVGSLTVHTTFVTGMINKFGQLFSHVLFHAYDAMHSRSRPEHAEHGLHLRKKSRDTLFILSIWLFYLVGAIIGTGLVRYWSVRALYLPIGVLLLVIAADQALPLAVEEEKEQSER
jgi:uncharacterized membrane protein YoaK (UPF0700 family)